MQKMIKRYLCIIAILSTMMGYGQTCQGQDFGEATKSIEQMFEQLINLAKSSFPIEDRVEKVRLLEVQRDILLKGISDMAQKCALEEEEAKKQNKIYFYPIALNTEGFQDMLQNGILRNYQPNITNNFTFPDGNDGIRRTGTLYQFPGLNTLYFTPNVSDNRYKVGIYYPLIPGQAPNSTNNSTTTIYIYDNTTQTTTNSSGATIPVFYMASGTTTSSSSTSGTTASSSLPTWYLDNDGDGWYSYTQVRETCPGPGWSTSTSGLDCDDNNPRWGYACNPVRGWFLDNDNDGYFAAVQMSSTMPNALGNWTDVITKGPDCDDTNAAIGMNCGAVVKWYIDKDSDKWYDKNTAPIESQYNPGGFFIRDPLGKDCDDTTKNITNHCYQFFYKDNDNDGWHSEIIADIVAPDSTYKTTTKGLDCDDTVSNADNKCGINIFCEISADDIFNTFGGSRNIIDPMIIAINKYAKVLGINDKVELQHFLAQAALESKNFTSTEEGTKYQTKSVMSTFGKFFNGIGNENKNPKLKNLSDFGTVTNSKGKIYIQNREALFNYIYADQNRVRVGYSPLGNTQTGDGYKFIGRGIIQITGRDNYTAFNNWYKKNIDPTADLVNNPKLLDTNKDIGTLASLWYFKNRVMDRLGGITDQTTADQVTKKINTKMLEKKKRADNFKSAKQKINCKN